MHMDLRTLGHFVALIDHGSFAAAANAVNLSQSAFSRSIQNLEQQAGHLLVDRNDKNLPPTSPGRLVLDYARPLLDHFQDLKKELDRFSVEQSGTLRLGFASSLLSGLLPQAVAAFMAEHPAVQVRQRSATEAELERSLLAREVDLAIADVSQWEADPRYRVIRLLPQRWFFYCRPGHPLDGEKAVDCARLFNYPLATSLGLDDVRKVLKGYRRQRDFVPAIQCDSAHAALALVKHSEAVGLVALEDRARVEAQGVLALSVRDMDAVTDERPAHHGIVRLRNQPMSALTTAFIEIIQELDVQRAQDAITARNLAV